MHPVFVVGCPRSGTALLRNMLRAHPRLSFPPESHFIPALFRDSNRLGNDVEVKALAGRILGLHWVRRWGLDLRPEDFVSLRSYPEVVDRLFTAYAAREGKPRWGDKTPQYVSEIETLVQLFPDCRVIHIIRDGRDVAISWLRTRMEPRNLYVAASWWRERVGEGRRAGARLSNQSYRELRYESLVTDPAEVMREICSFVGEDFDPAVLDPQTMPRWSRQGWWGPPRPSFDRPSGITSASVGGWRRVLNQGQRTLFESVAGDLLAELGYESEATSRTIGPLERVFWRTHHSILWATERLGDREFFTRLATFISLRRGELFRRNDK